MSDRLIIEGDAIPQVERAVRIEKVNPQIAILVMQRNEERNKLSWMMIRELRNALDRLQDDRENRVVILSGTNDAFCAGADLKLLQTLSEKKAQEYLSAIIELFSVFDAFPKSTIAAVAGPALGGGMEFSLMADFRIITENSVMGLPESRLGIVPGAGGVQRLTHFVGRGKALEIALLGLPISAQTAMSLGLVYRVCRSDELRSQAIGLADELAKLSPSSVRHIKGLIRQSATVSPAEADRAALDAMVECSQTIEFQNQLTEFFRK